MRRSCACIGTRISIILVTFLTLAACARQEVGNRALEYNNALSDFGNKQILLNAVRSAKRLPQYYAAVGDLTGDETLTGSLDGSFPFGRNTTNPFSLSPSLAASSGISNFKVGNLNKGKFARQLLAEIDPKLFIYYQNNGWRMEILLNIMVSHITIPKRYDRGLNLLVRQYCDSQYAEEDEVGCWAIDAPFDTFLADHGCERQPTSELNDARELVVAYSNHGRDPCKLAQFQSFVRKLLLLRPRLIEDKKRGAAKTIEEQVESKMPTGGDATLTTKYSKKTKPSEEQVYKIGFFGKPSIFAQKRPNLRGISNRLRNGLKLTKGTTNVGFELRSPEAMIYYLGQLIGSQVFRQSPYPASIVNPDFDLSKKSEDGALIPLFVVQRSAPTSGAVSVYHGGSWYSIPEPDHGSDTAHRSLQVLTLLNQVISLQTQAEDVPQQTNVNLIAN